MNLFVRGEGRAVSPVLLALALGASATGLLCQGSQRAAAQAAAGAVLWRGDPAQTSGVKTASWGSGTIEEDTTSVYSGSVSFKITSQGPFQGASIQFAHPTDLGPYLSRKDSYLEIAVLMPALSDNGQLGGNRFGFGGRGGGFPGGGPGGGFPGGQGGMPGGFPGRGGRGGFNNSNNTRTQKAPTPQSVRIVLATSGGKQVEANLPLASATTDNQWKLLHIPVPALTGLTADDAQIKELRIFSDSSTTFWLGEVRVVTDATPISITQIDEVVVPRNEQYQFHVTAAGGLSPLVFSWDWDATDGLQPEGEGRTVNHTYYKEGNFTATVTVSDLYGIKRPATMKFKVHVTP
jgi:hypothetical protein